MPATLRVDCTLPQLFILRDSFLVEPALDLGSWTWARYFTSLSFTFTYFKKANKKTSCWTRSGFPCSSLGITYVRMLGCSLTYLVLGDGGSASPHSYSQTLGSRAWDSAVNRLYRWCLDILKFEELGSMTSASILSNPKLLSHRYDHRNWKNKMLVLLMFILALMPSANCSIV